MLVTSKEILNQAMEENFAVLAPDFIDLDSARVFVKAAQTAKQPLILSYAQAHESLLSLEEAALIGKYVAQLVDVPIVLHLDHGTDLTIIKQAISLGFTSVMIDASTQPLNINIMKTQEVVAYAHKHGVVVEAEIGHVGSGSNYESHEHSDSIYTDVQEAITFVNETKVDSLAVSIGTAHGLYKGEPSLNFEVLHALRAALHIPLVLHGGSGSGDDNLKRCAHEGINKINIFTDFIIAAQSTINDSPSLDYLTLKYEINKAMARIAHHYFKLFAKEDTYANTST